MNKIKIRKSIMLLSKIRHNVYKNFKNKSNLKKLILIYNRYNKNKNIYKLVNIFVLINRGRMIINANWTVSIKYPFPKDFSELNTDCYYAQAGDIITLLPNTNYYGNLFIKDKTDIKIIGDNTSAIIGTQTINNSYVIKLNNCQNIYFGIEPNPNIDIKEQNGQGYHLTTALKGFYAENCSNITIQNLNIHNIGMEGLHILHDSSFCNIYNNRIYDTGLGINPDTTVNDAKFGEGIYIGSAYDNWDDKTIADKTHDINIYYNNVYNTTAECVDIKEGTYNGVVESNYFDGKKMVAEYADSWIDIKGEYWIICYNECKYTITNGIKTFKINTNGVVPNSGSYNSIWGNTMNCIQPNDDTNVKYAVFIDSHTHDNKVYSTNSYTNAINLTNIDVDYNPPPY